MVAVERDALLAGDETEAFAELEQEGLEAVDDVLLQVALEPVRAFFQLEELEHHRVFQNVARLADTLALLGEREDFVLVPALC